MSTHLEATIHPDAKREVEILAAESELYPASEEVAQNANVPDYLAIRSEALEDPPAFWDARAKELLDWYEPYEQVLDTSQAPFFKWFTGGKTNITLNALDRHIKTWRKNKLALIWEGEDGAERTFSYYKLWREVNRFANVLRGMGVKKGDTVTIYMGRVPELPIAMLAATKIGAIHSVVYGGFSEQALADRVLLQERRQVLVGADPGDRGKATTRFTIAHDPACRQERPADRLRGCRRRS